MKISHMEDTQSLLDSLLFLVLQFCISAIIKSTLLQEYVNGIAMALVTSGGPSDTPSPRLAVSALPLPHCTASC